MVVDLVELKKDRINKIMNNDLIKKIKKSKHNNIFLYRIAQVVLIGMLEVFLFAQGYPLWHIVLISCILFLLLMITKVREMAIGMFLAANNERIRGIINVPEMIREDMIIRQREEEERMMKEEIIKNLKNQPKN